MCAHSHAPCGGISLRAYLAGQALNGMLASETETFRTIGVGLDDKGQATFEGGVTEAPLEPLLSRNEILALECVEIADALIAELEGGRE